MTRAERLAAKLQRDRETLEHQRQAMAEREASLRADIRSSESALRDETRKATDKRRYQVGLLADEAGLFALTNAELAGVFAALAKLREGQGPGAVLEALLSAPEQPAVVLGNGRAPWPARETGPGPDTDTNGTRQGHAVTNTAEKSLAR